jgi:hypothetical protein
MRTTSLYVPAVSQVRDGFEASQFHRQDLARAFAAHLELAEFPCVGAKASLSQNALRMAAFGGLGSRENDAPLLEHLSEFALHLKGVDMDAPTLHSFAAVFAGPLHTDERRFEALLWSQLQRLHTLDFRRGSRWATDVATDPDSPKFSLSLAGHPFFVIGLHPGASRIARRFSSPVLVFNSHRQFERLREDGRYAKMQAATRARDTALQGSINPNLADFGTAAETRQYSGREVGADWRCPFHVMKQR